MKELSIEQKATAYDEAIDKVAHFIKKHIGLGCMIHPNSSEAKELFNIFPELKESEDERILEIIKHCIESRYLHTSTIKGISQKQCFAWLEKQGEPTDNDMVEALRTEYEKGRADVLRCIDPDEMVADFCSQPFSKTRSIASVYRQGIIDIVKRIDNNEKTSITSTRSIDNCGL